jgi:biotin-dependent carboxylase-like uncharacterized protein
MTILSVVAAGPLTTIQDLGRPGLASTGIGHSGPADRASFTLANRIVGNHENAAGIETTFGGLVIRASHNISLAVTGCIAPVTINDRSEGRNAVLNLRSGDTLTIGTPMAGVRSYLAVRGGIDVPRVLGSRSTDTLSGIGPAAVQPGDILPIGTETDGYPILDQAPVADCTNSRLKLRLMLGPRHEWFSQSALKVLETSDWNVTTYSNRVGIRLAGPHLSRTNCAELPSEGVVEGALQVPPQGNPTLFLADHPVTGGYPVIGVLHSADVALAAQARPGQQIKFVVSETAQHVVAAVHPTGSVKALAASR